MGLKHVVKKYNQHGACEVDCQVVKDLWGNLWRILQWNDKYTLIKYKRKDSAIVGIKVLISADQAKYLINELELEQVNCTIFKVASSWLKPQ